MSNETENKSIIREYKKDDFDKIIQLLETSDMINPYTFFTTDFFIRSRYSKCFVCEDGQSEIIGTIYGITKSKQRKNSEKRVLKFHIYMIYVKDSIENPEKIYNDLIDTMLNSINKIKEDELEVSEINATIPHDEKYDKYLLKILKDKDFFKYELIIRFFENGSSALRMKKLVNTPKFNQK